MEKENAVPLVGFTGARKGMTGDQAAAVTRIILELRPDEFHHGGCVGADAQAAELARTYGGCHTVRHPGDDPGKQDHRFLDDDYRPATSNLVRNRGIVDEVGAMIAAPAGFEEAQRSGTWATVRYARKVGRRLFVVWPDGTTA